MANENEIRKALVDACQERGKQAEIASAFDVHPSTVKRWIDGGDIPPPILKLLALYLFGEIPFTLVHPKQDLSSILEFEPDEWRIIEILATRAGQTPAQWIRSQILAYLAFTSQEGNQAGPSDSAATRESRGRGGPVPFRASPAARHTVPLYSGIAAGAPISAHVAESVIPVDKEYPDDHYALRVFGASMEPTIPDGSTIIVKAWPVEKGVPKKGSIVVYSDGTGSTLKEFGYRKGKPGEETDRMGNVPVLRSLNRDFPDVQTLEGGKIDAVFVEVVTQGGRPRI